MSLVTRAACKGRKRKHAAIWWKNLMERDHFKGMDCRIILKLTVRKEVGKVGSGYIWLCIGNHVELSYTLQCGLEFHIIREFLE
jgi:hypothetical protein